MDMPPFEELMHLAKTNPDALEDLRHALVEETIMQAPEHYHRKLRGLQFQIDMERRRATNPMSACIRISKMMHEHLIKLKETLEMDWVEEDIVEERATGTGSVIPFPSQRSL